MKKKQVTKEDFIAKSKLVWGDCISYEKVVYVDNNTPIIATCRKHGDFETRPRYLTSTKIGCPKCGKNYIDIDIFIKRAILKHGLKYDYSETIFTGVNNRIEYKCPIHGTISQLARNHLRGDGCGYCNGGKKGTTPVFIEKAHNIHGDKYDYSKVKYTKNNVKVDLICKLHGTFSITPNAHLSGRGCPYCSHEEQKTLIYGIGINDLYRVSDNGEHEDYYKVWSRMLERCYDEKYQIKKPTYIGCIVCDKWLLLSNFKKWFDDNYVEGYVLDKDVLSGKVNKRYSPETCCFIPQHLNTLLVKTDASRGEYPVGVTVHNKSSKFTARVSEWGKLIHIGVFKTKEEAFNAYKIRKEKHIKEVADYYYDRKEITRKVYKALCRYKVEITD